MNTASCEKEAPSLSRDEAIAILDTPDEELEALIDRASSLRYKYKGNRVSIHILTNARSGNCSQDCAYCAQSCRSTADIDKYKWVDEDKLYQDNDFVNDYRTEWYEIYRLRDRGAGPQEPHNERTRNSSLLLHRLSHRAPGKNAQRGWS